MAKGKKSSKGDKDGPQIISGLNHPMRREVLRVLHAAGEPLSPCQIAKRIGLCSSAGRSLSSVAYHVRALAGHGLIEEVAQRQVRGARQHFYASRVSRRQLVRRSLGATEKFDKAFLGPGGSGSKG